MLKIDETPVREGTVVLKLEGRVIGPWVEELERSCAEVMTRGMALTLDLSAVSFVDRRGIALLARLGTRGVVLLHCPRFVAEQLRGWTETER
jgi:anti-anti-sigma regulatory factor